MNSIVEKPTAPDHLRPETARWYEKIAGEYILESHHLRLLELAATAWDRATAARAALAKNGCVYENRFGEPRPRAEVKIEKDASSAYARFLRELQLDVDPPESTRIPGI